MYKIAVIGSRETVMGFKALGLEVHPTENGEDAVRVFRSLLREGDSYAIIYVEENLAQALGNEIERVKDSPTPAVILIPGKDGTLGLGQSALKAAVERAVGSDIL